MKSLSRLFGHEVLISLLTFVISTTMVFSVVYFATGKYVQDASYFSLYIDSWKVLFGNESQFGPRFDISSNIEASLEFGFQSSAILVLLSISLTFILSLSISLFLLYRKEWKLCRLMEQLLFFAGSVPVYMTIASIFLLQTIYFPENEVLTIVFTDSTFSKNILKYLVAALILSIGSGMVGELVRTFTVELERIMNEPFILTARARNALLWKHIARASIVPLNSAVISKIPFFIGAALIVERVVNLHGIATCMIEFSRNDFNFAAMFELSIVVVLFVVVMNMANRTILLVFDPRARTKLLQRI